MLIFQSYAQKSGQGEGEREDSEMGMKVRALQKFFESHSINPQEMSQALQEIEKGWKKNGISEFISTLTPGAQSAIYAASFAWGLENASQYVKRAMKLDEVKNADGVEERSKVVVESIQGQSAQALPQSEKSKETTRIVWGFYNEDMKETQAVSSKSETQSERQGAEVPLTAHEAVMAGIVNETPQPCLLYCSSVEAQEKRQSQMELQKKEELSTLLTTKQEAKIVEAERARTAPGAEKTGGAAEKERMAALEKIHVEEKSLLRSSNKELREAVELALQRKEETLREYALAEGRILAAVKKLEGMPEGEGMLAAVSSLLPDELQRRLSREGRRLSKKEPLMKHLLAWLSSCREGRGQLQALPLRKLIKLVSLSSMFKR
jgi:hypothetical protein